MFIKVDFSSFNKKDKKYYCESCNDVVVGKIKNEFSYSHFHDIVYCEICNKFLQYLKANPRKSVLINDYLKMPFGMHKGKTITEIVDSAKDYAIWFINSKFKSKAKNSKDIMNAEQDYLTLQNRFKEALALKEEVNKLLYQSLYNDL